MLVVDDKHASTGRVNAKHRAAPGWRLAVVAAVAVSALAGLAPHSAYSETMDSMEASAAQLRFDIESIESRAQAAVLSAVILYESERGGGTDAFDLISPDTQQTGEIYAFVLDAETFETVANGAFSDLHGVVLDTITFADRPVDDILSDLSLNEVTWVEYMASNPNTNSVQLKRSWLYLHDGYIFGSGYYVPESNMQTVVDDAVSLFESEGRAAFNAITPETAVQSDALYPFVLNFTTSETVAHGAYPHLLGAVPASSLHRADRPWSDIQEDLLTNKGTWASYVFTNPDTETRQLKRAWLYLQDGFIFASGYYLQDSRVQSLVDEAIHLYKSQGAGAFDVITPDPGDELHAFTHSFVLDAETLELMAHSGLPDRVGTTDYHLTKADRSLYQIRDELGREGGVWAAYISANPNTRTDQLTRTYLSEYDGYIFAAGYYYPDSRLQSRIDESIYAYRATGPAAFETISTSSFADGITQLVRNGTHVLARAFGSGAPAQPQVGPIPLADLNLNIQAARSLESNYNAAREGDGIATASIFSYSSITRSEQILQVYGSFYDGFVFSGTYIVADADAQSVVDYALRIYESNKENDAWVDIITPSDPIVTDAIYPFVLNATTWEAVAHGVLPDRIGVRAVSIINTSIEPFEDVLADLEDDGTAWVTYSFLNPGTGTSQTKRTWLVERDGYIFAAGYYLSDARIQAIAYRGTLTYDAVGTHAALAIFNNLPDEPDPLYTFVVDSDTGTVVAQGADPSILGPASEWEVALASEPGLLNVLKAENGEFVTYQFVNPRTGEMESKRTWLTMHDGYVFGVGYYASDVIEHEALLRSLVSTSDIVG